MMRILELGPMQSALDGSMHGSKLASFTKPHPDAFMGAINNPRTILLT